MKALLPIAVICAIFVVADVALNEGATIYATNRGIIDFGKAVQHQILQIVN